MRRGWSSFRVNTTLKVDVINLEIKSSLEMVVEGRDGPKNSLYVMYNQNGEVFFKIWILLFKNRPSVYPPADTAVYQ